MRSEKLDVGRKSKSMKVSLTDQMWSRLGKVAEDLQQSPSVLASLAISKMVVEHEAAQRQEGN